MTIARLTAFVALLLLAAPLTAEAQQQTGKVWRIGFLAGRARPASLASDAYGGFPRGMRELGYVEGRDFTIEWRFADGEYSRFPGLAAELVRLKVDVIVVSTPPAIPAVKQATTTIPIVMGISLDPVAAGFVASLARPGGNITGLAATTDVNVKHLDLLKTLLPSLSRVRVLVNPGNTGQTAVVKVVQAAGATVGVSVLPVSAGTADEIDRGFEIMKRERADAFILATDAFFLQQRHQIVALAVKYRLPWIVSQREYVDTGGLMSYGQPLAEFYRHAAIYVDKILRGAKPADLPVEQPTKFEFVINMGTAKALGLTIPPTLLLRVDHVIQ
ncbi:MAG: ABC transporter substrate-binding protein [Candidatus Rokubacteria bacterium]|nr:ABC transporter substrate-binding protein [Candidatus Rokubacteria bacterium]